VNESAHIVAYDLINFGALQKNVNPDLARKAVNLSKCIEVCSCLPFVRPGGAIILTRSSRNRKKKCVFSPIVSPTFSRGRSMACKMHGERFEWHWRRVSWDNVYHCCVCPCVMVADINYFVRVILLAMKIGVVLLRNN
jgi:hypothetical protein